MPDYFFVGGYFEYLWLLADVAVSAPVAYYGVAVRQSLDAADKSEGVAGEVVFVELPDDVVIRVDFD